MKMEWIFWIGGLLYLIVGESFSRKYEQEKKRDFFRKNRKNPNNGGIMSPKEKNKILLRGFAIFFFWLIYVLTIGINSLLRKEVM